MALSGKQVLQVMLQAGSLLYFMGIVQEPFLLTWI